MTKLPGQWPRNKPAYYLIKSDWKIEDVVEKAWETSKLK
jgi:hypothetical protein